MKMIALKNFNQIKKDQEIDVSEGLAKLLDLQGLARYHTYNTTELKASQYLNRELKADTSKKQTEKDKEELEVETTVEKEPQQQEKTQQKPQKNKEVTAKPKRKRRTKAEMKKANGK